MKSWSENKANKTNFQLVDGAPADRLELQSQLCYRGLGVPVTSLLCSHCHLPEDMTASPAETVSGSVNQI